EQPALAHHTLARVGPVGERPNRRHASGVGKALAEIGRGPNPLEEVALVELAIPARLRGRHEADAGAVVLQRDDPPPAVGNEHDADVALARSRVTPSALEVRENGEVPERRIHAPETEPAGDERLLPRGVDQDVRFDLAALARAGAPVDTGAPEIGVEGGDLHALADVHAGARGVLEQHRIELGTIDLEGRARSADEAL